jgi:hypothetical protein
MAQVAAGLLLRQQLCLLVQQAPPGVERGLVAGGASAGQQQEVLQAPAFSRCSLDLRYQLPL